MQLQVMQHAAHDMLPQCYTMFPKVLPKPALSPSYERWREEAGDGHDKQLHATVVAAWDEFQHMLDVGTLHTLVDIQLPRRGLSSMSLAQAPPKITRQAQSTQAPSPCGLCRSRRCQPCRCWGCFLGRTQSARRLACQSLKQQRVLLMLS